MAEKQREIFGSKIGFILSTIGFSVGVGTLWRFPYVCGENGGGLFLLTYTILMLAIGIPLFSAEIGLGRATRQSPVGAYRSIKPGTPWVLTGYFNMLCIIFVIGYTLPVYAWILHYLWATPIGTFTGMTSEQVGGYFGALTTDYGKLFPMLILNAVLTMLVVRNQLQKGIEKMAKILLPALAVIMMILAGLGFSFEGSAAGLKFLFSLDFESFGPRAILVALGQTFFSLGVAMAVALVFGSYQREDDTGLVKNSTIISCSVVFVAILSGLMIFPMAAAFNLELAGGPGLTFVTMPNVFNIIPGGSLWGGLFYFAFYIAAFTSAVAGWEAVMGFLMDEYKVSRNQSLFITLGLVLVIGVPATLSMGIFEKLDMVTTNVFLMAGALAMTIFIGWVWGIDKLAEVGHFKDKPGLMAFFTIVVKYIAPIMIAILALNLFGII